MDYVEINQSHYKFHIELINTDIEHRQLVIIVNKMSSKFYKKVTTLFFLITNYFYKTFPVLVVS